MIILKKVFVFVFLFVNIMKSRSHYMQDALNLSCSFWLFDCHSWVLWVLTINAIIRPSNSKYTSWQSIYNFVASKKSKNFIHLKYSKRMLYCYFTEKKIRKPLLSLWHTFNLILQEHVLRLRKISNEVFQLLFKLRRPTDTLGTRFNTVCHGDMWMGNLMFRKNPDTGESEECYMIDLHSAQYLSPATDLAHLLLTSTTRDYR